MSALFQAYRLIAIIDLPASHPPQCDWSSTIL